MSTDQWDTAIRVEHLVAPGPRMASKVGNHLWSCNCECWKVRTCSECSRPSFPTSISGRWDSVGEHTARPFDPVWVQLSCGCDFGDQTLSKPVGGEDA